MMKPLLILFLSLNALAHEAGEMSIKVGTDQGITEVSEEKGFKLNDAAQKRLKLSYVAIQSSGSHTLPDSALVRTLADTGVYRRRDGFIKRIEAKAIIRQGGKATFRSDGLKPGDEVLTEGVGFVRIIESAFGAGEKDDGHEDHADEKGDDHADHDDHEKKPHSGEESHGHDERGGEHHD